jgi:predicted permease
MLFDSLRQDLRFGIRALWRTPGFTVTALTLLVLSIGTSTAIFSIAYGVLLRPLPYPDPDRLVYLTETGGSGVAWPNYQDWRTRATTFESLACSLLDSPNLTSVEPVRRVDARSVTSNFFSVLGARSFRGRLFTENDALLSATRTVVLSYGFWMQQFGGNPAALGQTLTIDQDETYTIIGILPPEFRYETKADLFVLLEPRVATNFRGMQDRATHTNLYAVGRLKPTVSLAAARAEMQTIAASLAVEYSRTNKARDVQIVGLADHVISAIGPTLVVLAGAVGLLLIIACINLANLLLIRGAARAHEFTVRAALGGDRRRLVRQVLIEQTMLVAVGGVLGALAGMSILRLLVTLAPRNTPRLNELQLDQAVLLWTTAISSLVAFAFGLIPAVKASTVRGQQGLVRAGRGVSLMTSPLRRALMIAEIAVATVLLCGSALMVQTMYRLTQVDLGFDPHNLQTFMFGLRGQEWTAERRQVFYDPVVERLRAVPGVENAALTYSLPLLGSNWWNSYTILDRPAPPNATFGELPSASMNPVTASYFQTLGIPLIRGRYFDSRDSINSLPVAIINQKLAHQVWPNEDPIGKQIRMGLPSDPYGPWRTIVGIVGDVKLHGIDRETPVQIYMPIVQQPRDTVFAVVRTRGPQDRAAIEAAFHDFNRTIPLYSERTLDEVMTNASSRQRVAMAVLSIFGSVAVFLALIGLYGVIAQSVAERTQEIGVRMALGATPGEVLRLFLQQGVIVTVVGIACGLVAAIAASRSLQSLVFGVSTTDPATLAAVAVLLAVAALAASFLPACSAARVDPLLALRVE